MVKRILLFFCVNLLVVLTVSCVLEIFQIRPYLSVYGIDYSALLTFCLIWGMVGAFVSLLLSKQLAKWLMQVRVIDPMTMDREEARLQNILHDLSLRAGLSHTPEIGIFPSNRMNAFATGPSQKRSLVAVSNSLLEKLSDSELEGVIAHELTHIVNGDMVTMTLLQGVVNAFVMFLARSVAFVLSMRGDQKKRFSPFSYYLFTRLFESIFMIFGAMVIAFFSRYREFRADRGAADLVGKKSMISALQALQTEPEETRQAVMNTLMISRNERKGLFLRLFSTHPSLEDRIHRLTVDLRADQIHI